MKIRITESQYKLLTESESYSFSEPEEHPFHIIYKFTNKDNINFTVYFKKHGLKQDKVYYREYRASSDNDNLIDTFGTLSNHDIFKILSTVTDITVYFISKFLPNKIIIEHIPTQKERKHITLDNIKDYQNKRSIINKRFLERSLPPNYRYELKGSMSTITKL